MACCVCRVLVGALSARLPTACIRATHHTSVHALCPPSPSHTFTVPITLTHTLPLTLTPTLILCIHTHTHNPTPHQAAGGDAGEPCGDQGLHGVKDGELSYCCAWGGRTCCMCAVRYCCCFRVVLHSCTAAGVTPQCSRTAVELRGAVSRCGVPFAAAGAQAADAAFRFRLCCRLNISKHTTPCAVPRLPPPVSPSLQVVALAGRSAERLVLGDANISTVGASQLQVSFFSYCIADCWYCAAGPVCQNCQQPHHPYAMYISCGCLLEVCSGQPTTAAGAHQLVVFPFNGRSA